MAVFTELMADTGGDGLKYVSADMRHLSCDLEICLDCSMAS